MLLGRGHGDKFSYYNMNFDVWKHTTGHFLKS